MFCFRPIYAWYPEPIRLQGIIALVVHEIKSTYTMPLQIALKSKYPDS